MWSLSRLHTDKANAQHLVLLRPCRERPRDHCATDQRDELAPLHVEHGDFLPYALLARPPTRALGFPAPQPATARLASPWGGPELF